MDLCKCIQRFSCKIWHKWKLECHKARFVPQVAACSPLHLKVRSLKSPWNHHLYLAALSSNKRPYMNKGPNHHMSSPHMGNTRFHNTTKATTFDLLSLFSAHKSFVNLKFLTEFLWNLYPYSFALSKRVLILPKMIFCFKNTTSIIQHHTQTYPILNILTDALTADQWKEQSLIR